MKTTAHVDPGKGHVYRIDYPSLSAARAIVRGPYCRDSRIVLVAGSKVEVYERGRGLAARRVA